MPENPNEGDYQEGEYLLQYFKERFTEVLKEYEEFNRLPIMNILFYMDHRRNVEIVFRATNDAETLLNLKLPEAGRLILEACREWEMKLGEFPAEKLGSAGVEFSALKDHIKGNESKGGEGEE